MSDPVSGRVSTTLFALLCAGGSATALSLAVVEARATDPVVADVASSTRSGLTTTAHVEVRNTTSDEQCARLRVVALDRAGHDLGSSRSIVVRLAPQAKRDVQAEFTLTRKQYDEELSLTRAAVDRCG
jgi:hypothetical protein